jgi:uridine phosphorylase
MSQVHRLRRRRHARQRDRCRPYRHIVVPDSAIRDEGTSYHYLKPARDVAPTPRALAAIEAELRENNHEYIRGKTLDH